ncbi:MAG: NAD(P)-dependent alcohol dehydrogenase [Acidobacteria bacterium]|nr:MAG: NAD(P)-dependent alcohol dehydrogenase [Acidobacteriota bacterium]REK03116.1 MAG: NAD(P)-dependent alcohol dehydrogenase [Acidobacteriota bacterium]REK15464.1 MAG: NAD(P)-dependent alcohol dehydrogenase [Acidobacteriota bacterium]REK45814.1 MAG: NAD(P)-dependent alcohol dehydrogenase [Acidobacteriota bacterium]
MSEPIKAYAAMEAGGELEPYEFDPGELGSEEVEIDVKYCGICHSDLSMRDNEWEMSEFPFVGGHEAVGTVSAVGHSAKGIEVGDTVGLGWNASTCGHCTNCIAGSQIHCPELVGTIVQRHGGFANRVRCKWNWAIKLPDGVDPSKAGPLFCGGITVFNPFVQLDIKPTDKVGVIGIGGLGHLALQFADKWGCEVTAFTSDLSKEDELRKLGADHVVNSRDSDAIAALDGRFDMILSTVNVSLDWAAYFKALGPKGRLHIVGAVLDPMTVYSFNLIERQRSVTGSATGSPDVVAKMLEFCARHDIETITENYPMSRINEAFDRLKSGKTRYRIVLENDFE